LRLQVGGKKQLPSVYDLSRSCACKSDIEEKITKSVCYIGEDPGNSIHLERVRALKEKAQLERNTSATSTGLVFPIIQG
jgi:hypothetical protein